MNILKKTWMDFQIGFCAKISSGLNSMRLLGTFTWIPVPSGWVSLYLEAAAGAPRLWYPSVRTMWCKRTPGQKWAPRLSERWKQCTHLLRKPRELASYPRTNEASQQMPSAEKCSLAFVWLGWSTGTFKIILRTTPFEQLFISYLFSDVVSVHFCERV